jgi:hypothetical protein
LKKHAPTGFLEIEVQYGGDKDALEYLFKFNATVAVALGKSDKNWQATLQSSLKLLEHEKI